MATAEAETSIKDEEELPGNPLRDVAESFAKLAVGVKEDAPMSTADFAHACSQLTILFRLLGVAFKFAEGDFVSKVTDLQEASADFATLPAMIDSDVANDIVRRAGSHTRNLLRVKRGVEMLKLLLEKLLENDKVSMRDAASFAYTSVFAAHHSWTIRTAVGAGMYTMPNKRNFLKRLKEDESSWREPATRYVSNVQVVLLHTDSLFTSRDLGLDW